MGTGRRWIVAFEPSSRDALLERDRPLDMSTGSGRDRLAAITDGRNVQKVVATPAP